MYQDVASLRVALWDFRRAALEFYGWVSFVLHTDRQGWRRHKWDRHFVSFISRSNFLVAPKRGCIVSPSISLGDIEVLVQDDVPVHYQWRNRDGELPIGGWLEPRGEAARFDPYSFKRIYDYAAYKQAGGQYDNSARDRSILGRSSASQLSAEYHRWPRPPMFQLPPLPPSKGKGKKAALRCFARDYPGAEITEITKAALGRLEEEEDGKTHEHKNAAGDMRLFTKSPRTTRLHAFDLRVFFNELDSAISEIGAEPQQPIDTTSIRPSQPVTSGKHSYSSELASSSHYQSTDTLPMTVESGVTKRDGFTAEAASLQGESLSLNLFRL
jgi:hypothetical protein